MTKETLIRILPFQANSASGSRSVIVFCGLCVLLPALCFISFGVGAVKITPFEVLAILFQKQGSFDSQQETLLFAIRLPRVLLGVLVGAGLAVSGATMQGLFRNPLADPGLIGISTGCALSAAVWIVFGETVSFKLAPLLKTFSLSLVAFPGGLLATLIVYRLGQREGRTDVPTMLLAGVAVSALNISLMGILSFISTDAQLRNITFWTLGSLGGATWTMLIVTAPFILIPVIWLPKLARSLNAILLGEAEAEHLGVNTENLKRKCVVLTTMAIGASVASAGMIGFVGLVVPHLLRLLIGADHRVLLPCSALLGASLLLMADLSSRTIVAPAELPVGSITTLIGVPFFLWLLISRKS